MTELQGIPTAEKKRGQDGKKKSTSKTRSYRKCKKKNLSQGERTLLDDGRQRKEMKYATLESKTFPFPFRGNSDDVTGFTAMRVVDFTSSTRCPLLRRVLAMQKENSI